MKNRRVIDPQAAVHEHLDRIRRLNPRLNAFIQVDGSAQAGTAGPLRGFTVGVKESQPVRGLSFTWSSPKFRGQVADRDAVLVQRLKAAGAAILGKTNAPELVASVGTVSPLFGATQNPWREGVTPGGSSGGSAAAVAARLCTVATGDDYGGSIRMPASCCGVVGLRPSPGRVPEELPDPAGINSRGPIARSVADARATYAVMAAVSPHEVAGAKRRLLAITRTGIGMDSACSEASRRAGEALAGAGHEVVFDALEWDALPVLDAYKVVRRVSLAAWPGDPAEYGPGVRALMTEGREISGAEFFRAHQAGLKAGARVRQALEDGFDAILTPTLGLVPMPIEEVPPFLGEAYNRHVQFVLPVSFSLLPAISVPAGRAGGLPIGVQLVGHYRREFDLLDLAESLESAPGFGFEPPPGFD
ncbi:MAG: amidase [Chloroflexi bacterium]|nr:MAG: amidase [Chloroflexota bacterium]